MWVIKIGGSWIKNSKLDTLIILLKKFVSKKIILVTGGGVIADSIREIYEEVNMTEETANYLALKATEIFAYFLKSKNKNINLTSDVDSFSNKKLNVWLPSNQLKVSKDFEKTWESTSDSVASWLYGYSSCEGILFVKSLELSIKKNYDLINLQNRGILDRNLKKYLNGKKKLKIIGPEIIDLLKEHSEWKVIESKFNNIIL